MTRDLFALADWLNKVSDYTDVFREEDQIKATYIKLAQIMHPDKHESGTHQRRIATQAFQRLNSLHAEAQAALAEGRFGEPIVLATIRGKHAVHDVKRKLAGGDVATLFQSATVTDDGATTGLVKIAKNVRDNELLHAEAKALKKLHAEPHPLTRHYPLLLDTFIRKEDRRRANVVEWQDGCHNLEQLLALSWPGLAPVHVVWIWRRLLQGLNYAHDQGLVHGAVLPPHILILPSQHGVILVDWCYSVPMEVSDPKSKTIKAVVGTYRDWYPEEVTAKTEASPATDIAMAARCMIYLLGGDPTAATMPTRVPRAIQAWFKGCLQTKQSMRPDDAGKLLREFDDLLRRLGEPWYPRRFVELVV